MTSLEQNIESIYPLTPPQQGILFEALLAPESGVYLSQFLYALAGELKVSALQKAWEQVVQRHAVLRSLVVWKDKEKPLQIVRCRVDLPWQYEDWRMFSDAEKRTKLEEFLAADRRKGFDLSRAPLMRLKLIRMTEDCHELVWSNHHLLLDGWSEALIRSEVMDVYQAICKGEDYAIKSSGSYRDYVRWLQQQDLSEAEAFWRNTLKGLATPTPLTVDKAETEQYGPTGDIGDQEMEFSAEKTGRLKEFCRQQNLTLNTLMQAGWALLLNRYSGEDDVLFGTVVSGRPSDLPGVEYIVGMFINTLPVCARFAAGDVVSSWLKNFQIQLAEMRQYEHSPMVSVHGWSQVPRGLPLFESLLNFVNYPVDSSARQQQSGLQLANIRSIAKINFPLSVIITPRRKLTVRISYDVRRFDAETIERMLGHYQRLLESMVAAPDQRLSDLPLLTEAERYQILVEWNRTERDFPRDKCVHELFEEQAERTPDAVAVVFGNQQLTYRELNAQANRLAHHLRKLRVGPDTLVGICVERSREMVIGLLGILKAGGAYVPLDPEYPKQRLAFMMEDANVPVLLTQARLAASLPANQTRIVRLDADWPAIAAESPARVLSLVQAHHLAYMIYTSGSTGSPKGVLVEHGALVQHCLECREFYGLTSEDRVLQFASLSFDAAIEQILPPLLSGARVVLREAMVWTPGAFQQKLEELGLTVIDLPPSYWHQLAEGWANSVEPVSAHRLRLVIIGGDVISAEALKIWQQTPLNSVRLLNAYGPTETVITATSFETPAHGRGQAPLERIPIGRPRGAREIYVLDRWSQPVPVGVAGELHIGGTALARGYHNRPELTAEKFIADPFANTAGARLYRTGDLARYLADGNIEFLGRLDNQVKIRGFRVELGEIEEVLSQHPGVQTSVVVAREDTPGDKRLVAYTVNRDGTVSSSELREYLLAKLPDYMVPAAFVTLEALPLTPNGKVDRKALPKPDFEAVVDKSKFVAPSTPTEIVLARIWCEVLGLKHVGIHDNFFELGGHSIRAVQIISKINKSLILNLPIPVFFQNPTIKKLATVFDQENHDKREPKLIHNNESATSLVTFQAKGNRPPLFFLHGDWTGGGFYCGRLSQQLGEDQPFYALPPYRSGKQTALTIEEMATYHIAAIQEHTPHGPYLMGGYCVGATVVTEIVRQLVEQGEKVTHLLLIDPPLVSSQLLRGIWPVVDGVGEILKWDLQKKIYYFDRYGVSFDRWLGKLPRTKFIALYHRLGFANRIGSSPITAGREEGDGDDEILNSLDYAVYTLASRLCNLKPLSVPTTVYFPEETPPSRRRANHARKIFPIVTVEMVPGNHRTCIIKHTSALVDKMKKTLGGLSGLPT